MSKRLEARQKEVSPAPDIRECRQPCDFLPNRALRDFVFQGTVLVAADRIALVAQFVKVPVVHPNVLRELELSNEARADNEGGDAALDTVLRSFCWQRRPVGAAAADHTSPLHVRRRVSGIHAANVRT